MAELHAGAAQLDITPLIGTTMPTLFNPRTSIGIHDPLHSKALVLRAGDETVAFVCLDLLVAPGPDVVAAREIIEERCGIPADCVLISATHTHSSPGPGGRFGVDLEPVEYHRWLSGRIADSVTMALARLEPARIGWGVGALPQHVHNRRYHMKDGSVRMNPGRGNPDVIKAAGPTDPDVMVVAVLDAGGQPLAVLGNYALHYVGGTRGPEFSADYYGAVQRLMNKRRQADFPVLWTNGCSGDINNVDVFGPPAPRQPYEQMELVASDAVDEALRVWGGMTFTGDVRLAAAVERFEAPLRRPSAEQLAAARELYADEQAEKGRDWVLAKELVLASELPSPEPAETQAVRVNELGIAGLPGEIFCQLGLDLKARSPLATTIVVGLASGYLGYIPTPDDFERGGYETWLARSSRCAPGVGPLLVDRGAAALERVAAAW